MKPEELSEYLAVMKRQYDEDLADALADVKIKQLQHMKSQMEWEQSRRDLEERHSQLRIKEHKQLMAQLREDSKQSVDQLLKENQQLREQLELSPTNSLYVMAGALIEMLTTPRRNQSRLKLELQDLGLKGFSEGSLNSHFSAANKAIKAAKASKDGG